VTLLLLLLLQGPHARLEGRVPGAALPGLDSLIAQAVAESLPTEPLVQKALEGGAKGIPVPRLVNGVRHGLVQLRDARAIVSRATPARASLDGDVAAVAAALARGLDPGLIERLLSADSEPPGPVLHAAADLVAHRFPADSAAELLRTAPACSMWPSRRRTSCSGRGGGRPPRRWRACGRCCPTFRWRHHRTPGL